jgi:hypothetical protein
MPLLFSNYRKLLQCYSSISPWCFKSYYGNPSLIIDSSKALLVLLNLSLMFWILILQQCFFDDRIIENCFDDVALQSLDASNPRLMTMLLWSYFDRLRLWCCSSISWCFESSSYNNASMIVFESSSDNNASMIIELYKSALMLLFNLLMLQIFIF